MLAPSRNRPARGIIACATVTPAPGPGEVAVVTEISTRFSESGDSLTIAVDLSDTRCTVHQTQLGTRVVLAGWPADATSGSGLPARTLWVALPEGAHPRGAEARVIATATLTDGPVTLAPSPAVHPDSPLAFSVAARPGRSVARRRAVPPARLLGTRTLGSVPVALVQVSPARIEPDGSLALATRFDITLPLEREVKATVRMDRTALSDSRIRRGIDLAASAVVNPGDLPRLHPVPRDLTRAGYLIVTDDFIWDPVAKAPVAPIAPGLTGAFGKLRDWKASLGFTAHLVTVTEIVSSTAASGFKADFKTGAADLQEIVRRFVSWACANWGIGYVLLGGDQTVVPIRQLKIGSWTELMPTDMYYSALDPVFDLAEGARPMLSQIDTAALEPDVSLGRAPVTTRAEAETFVAKVIAYERAPLDPAGSDWLRRILFAAAKLGGDAPAEFIPSPVLPPTPDHYYHATGAAYSLLQLEETIAVTQDSDPNTTSPGGNHFNKAPGTAYVKICLDGATYRLPQALYAVTQTSSVLLPHDVAAKTSGCGWFYTDWQDHDGPCHDASNVNYPTNWIIAYLPTGLSPLRFDVHLEPALRTGYNLLSKTGPGAYSAIPHDPAAGPSRRGWYFARSASDVGPMPTDPVTGQAPSSWIAVFNPGGQLAPAAFVLDPTDEADTEIELEQVRAAVATELPHWDAVSRLYPDVVDLPAPDQSGDVAYYTQDRLRAKLNAGQHFLYAAGHGLPECTLWGGEGGILDEPLADALVNAPRHGIGFGSTCLSGRYTSDSLGRHLVVKNPSGGLVAYVAFMDTLQMGLGVPFGKRFLQGIATTGRLGPALDARATLLEPGTGVGHDDTGLRTVLGMSLLGDPAMVIHNTISEPTPSIGLPYFFASEAIAMARLGGYSTSDRNKIDAQAQWQWTVGKVPDLVLAELKDRYTRQFQRQLAVSPGSAADFYADTSARLAAYGLAGGAGQDPQARDPNRDAHRIWAFAMLLLPAGAGIQIVLTQLLSRLDDAYYALFARPRRFLEMLFVSETVAIDRVSGAVTTATVDGLAARACATRLAALRDELLANAEATLEGASATARADYYAVACLRLNAFGVDFRSASANSLDLGAHRSWALNAALPNVVEQLNGRIRRIFDQLGCGEPPAAEVRIVQTQGGQTIEVPGSRVDFGAPVAGQAVIRKLRIYDAGDGEFLVTSPLLMGGFTTSNTTVVLRNQRVDVMTACEVEICFTASGSVPVSGTLRLDTTAAATPAITIDLRAAPLAPLVRFEPMGLDFGPQKIGVPRTQSLIVRNSGTCDATDLVLDMSWMQGPTAAQFRLVGGPAPHSSLAVGASAQFEVEFTPSQPVIVQNALTVTYRSAADPSGASKTCAIILGGWGIAPAISVPASLDFGPIQPGQPSVRSLFVQNTGQAGLVLSAISVQGGLPSAFSLVQPDGSTAPALSGPLPAIFPGTATEIKVSAAFPRPNAHLTDGLCIACDDPAHPQVVVPLSAVTAGSAGTVRPETLRFGVDPQPPNDVATLTIVSTGTADLALYSIAIAGVPVATDGSRPAQPQDKLDFVAEGLPARLTPLAGGSSLAFKIRFRPLSSGALQARLIVDTNAGKLNTVVLTGTKS